MALASCENEGFVRDPDERISGTNGILEGASHRGQQTNRATDRMYRSQVVTEGPTQWTSDNVVITAWLLLNDTTGRDATQLDSPSRILNPSMIAAAHLRPCFLDLSVTGEADRGEL